MDSTALLGISGYTFADLHDSERLASLYDRFCEEVEAAKPDLWLEWDAYRRSPDAPRAPVALSNLLVAMAPYVSRFLTRLFDVEPSATAITESTRAQDDIFRFKVDFVRRRAFPLVKAGAHVAASAEDDAVVEKMTSPAEAGRHVRGDFELALARAGCGLLDREKADKEGVAAQLDALKRWCAARLHDPAYRHWVIFRFPETLDYWNLVEVKRDPRHIISGPDSGLRRRDGFKLTDARMNPREVLSEIHYCVLCHERDKDSCSKGLHDSTKITVNPLGIELDGCPLDEKISEMHVLRKSRRRRRRAGARRHRQPDVPRHRPPHLQRLHEVVHLPEAGAGQHPADRNRRAHRRAADAVGRRDLRAAHPLEPAQRPPPVRAPVQRQERPGRRPRAGRATRSRTTS